MTVLPAAKILLVDDLDENLVALEALLRRDGRELLIAKSGREALELLLVHDVALALLDVQMPEMDGFELAELMRGSAKTKRVPIVFLTAGAHDDKRVFRGYELGAFDFLYKPLDPVLLDHKVTTFVELWRRGLERERLSDELREMLRLNEMFVAAVTHDLRSPLSTITMGASLLDTEPLTPSGKRTLERMRSGSERMLGVLEQLYDLARARVGGGIPIDPRPTNLRTLADRIVEELRLAYPERSVVLTYDEGSTTGVWDAGRLGQVLANVIGNALRYGTRGIDVAVSIKAAAPTVVVEVVNGGAIAEDLLPRIFDPFRVGASPSRESLGLGLFIASQIVAAHGGTIQVESTEATGTKFRIELPRTASRSVPPPK